MKTLCPHPDRCGSCRWSHIPYRDQLKQKLADINGSFDHVGLDLECTNIIGSPVTDHYRNRMDFIIDFKGNVGMREKGKWWKTIDNHSCFIADTVIDQLFTQIRTSLHKSGLSYYDRKAHTGLLRYAVVRVSNNRESMITIVTSAPKDEAEATAVKAWLEQLAVDTVATTVIWSINNTITDVSFGDELRVISGPGAITETMNALKFRITPNAFFQTNSHAAGVLMDTVSHFTGDVSDKTVLDLYCGSGFFALSLADSARRVIGVESVPEAIADALMNAQLNDVVVEWHAEKTENFSWQQYKPDLLILDPPRSGMADRALQDVINSAPAQIIFVSCNYKYFSRAMLDLQQKYSVSDMTAIDMFPHTPHVELVANLQKK